MNKKILLLVGFSLTLLTSYAQDNSSSPYSYFGLGELKFKGTHNNKAMGGMAVMTDSLHINLLNPAAYGKLRLTNFSIGGTTVFNKLQNSEQSEKAQRTSLDYLAIGFPVGKKSGISFGLMPFSAVGYKVQKITLDEQDPNIADDDFERRKYFTGSGEINRVYLGYAYNFSKNFSLGLDAQYNFGSIDTKSKEYITGITIGTRELNNSSISGMSFNFGALYQTKVKDKYNFSSSFTFSPQANLTSKNSRTISRVSETQNGSEITSDERTITVNDTNLKIPLKYSLGTSFGKTNVWMIGAEIAYAKNSEITNRFDDIQNASFENATKFSLGGYYIPKYDSFNSYFSRVVYRAGLRYEKTGLIIDNQSINDFGITFGLGLPLGVSTIDLGLEYGKRGTTTNNLIQENYLGLSVGLSFNDVWFKKRKID